MKTYCTTWLFVLLLIPLGMTAQDNLKIKDQNGNVLLEAREEGILIRKMTTAERIVIAGLDSDENGLMVYDKDTKSIWLWHDTEWVEIDGIDLVNDADHDPTNELQDWLTLPGIPAGFLDGLDDVNDADADPTNELQSWGTLPGKPAGFADGTDDVNDADADPTNELQNWGTLPGKPTGFADGIDDVNDADSNPLNEKNNTLTRNGTNLELTDVGGTLVANIGWAVDAGKVFNTTDNIGIGTNTTPAKLTVQSGAVLFNGPTGAVPVSGAGTRLMWVPEKEAFRAGVVTSTQWDNANIGQRSFVAGGSDNLATGYNSIVAGGGLDSAIANGAFAGGGYNNTASGINAFVGGGDANTAFAGNAFVGGGDRNRASGGNAFVGGGERNVASGINAQVAAGLLNTASGTHSFIGGGYLNTVGGYASFATGRENTVPANHGFAGGYGLLVKSYGEAVFGSFNSDYSPTSSDGFASTDRLFTIGNGMDISTRSNAMTILKNGYVGIGTDIPSTSLYVKGSKGLGEFVMVVENANHEGSGLKIKIDGSHPLFVTGQGGNPDFFVTHPGSSIVDVFEPLANDIRTYLLNNNSLDISDINFSQIASPGGLMDQLGLVDLVSGGVCKGAKTLVDLVNGIGMESITLPDLNLEAIPDNVPDIPVNFPNISIPNLGWDPTDPCLSIGPYDACIPLGPFSLPLSGLNSTSAIIGFNSVINSINTGIDHVNDEIEIGFDNLKGGLELIDGLEIPLPQLAVPTNIGPITCPNPNPWDNFSFSFEVLNPLDYNIINPLSSENAFITFADQNDNVLGAITAQGLGEFSQDYFSQEKVLEIGSHVTGLFSDDGNIVENLISLGKDAIAYYKATDKIGVLYSSGNGDYAEWLERENVNEQIGYGDIIGVRGGKISLSLVDAEQVMVVSKAPIILGNIPEPGKEKNGNNIAFIGQVPVKVMGPVHTGDFIIANSSTPGYGIAVSEKDITAEQMAFAVGKSWETNLTPGFKFVNAIVGMHNNGWATPVTKLQERLDAQEAAISQLTARLDQIEYGNSLVVDRKKGNR